MVSPKVKLWLDKLEQLEKVDLPQAQRRVGEAAESGDWEENAEYEDAINQLELIQGRINDIKLMLKKLEKEGK